MENVQNYSSLSAFNCFRKALFFPVFSRSLYLFTISLAKEKLLTVAYSFTMFSKHSFWHSFDISISHWSRRLFQKLTASGEVWTSSTNLSTCNELALPDLVRFLKHISETSAMFRSYELGAQSAPWEIEDMYSFSSVGTFTDHNNACISWFLGKSAFFDFLLFLYNT